MKDIDMPSVLPVAPRSGSAIDVGNVIAGDCCRDEHGAEHARVTAVLFGTHLQPVSVGGVDIAGNFGVLHMDPFGRYAYVRTGTKAPPTGAPDAVDRFKFQIVDQSGLASVGVLDFRSNPATAPARSAATTAYARLDAISPDPEVTADDSSALGDPIRQRLPVTV